MQNLVWVFNHVFLATTLILNKKKPHFPISNYVHVITTPPSCNCLYLEVTRSNTLAKTMTTDKLTDRHTG